MKPIDNMYYKLFFFVESPETWWYSYIQAVELDDPMNSINLEPIVATKSRHSDRVKMLNKSIDNLG